MKTILITGATDGIGLALAHLYRHAGERIILVGRRDLATLADPIFSAETYIQADLSVDGCETIIANWLSARSIEALDIVVNNAGVGWQGDVATQSAESIHNLVQVNLVAPIAITHALLPHLSRTQGKVVFVSSIVAFLPTPDYAVYGATKAALDGFARSLRVEQAGIVDVQVIHPGATKTAMPAKIGIPAKTAKRFPSAEKVASEMLEIIETDKRTATVGFSNRLIVRAAKTLPRLFNRVLGKKGKKTRQRGSQAPLHAVITGSADGIGKALAQQYSAAGYAVTGIDVDQDRSQLAQAELQQAGASSTILTADITESWGWIDDLPPVDVFVHNAGISAAGDFASLDLAAQKKVIALNLTAPLQMTARLLSAEKLTATSALVFLSSLSYFVSYPGATVYAATKDGLTHYARSLAAALGPSRPVTTVFPGPTRTAHARRYSPDNSRESNRMPPEKVAEAIFNGQQSADKWVIPGFSAQLFARFGRLTPRLMEWAMKKTIFDKLPKSGMT